MKRHEDEGARRGGTTGAEKKLLNWAREDIEQRVGVKGGKYTDVNLGLSVAVAVVLTAALFGGMRLLPAVWLESRGVQMLLARGWTPYAMTFLTLWATTMLWVKWRKLAYQMRAFRVEVIPRDNEFSLTRETAEDALRRLRGLVDNAGRFVLFNRIERALQNLRNVGNLSDVSEMLRAQAENDESATESSYGLLEGIVWSIPILGFIGTVTGLSGAVGRFGTVLGADADLGALREGLAPVTDNLGVAFDTTFLALVLALGVQMAMSLLKKKEYSFLDACRDYAHENVISRLRLQDGSGERGAGRGTGQEG